MAGNFAEYGSRWRTRWCCYSACIRAFSELTMGPVGPERLRRVIPYVDTDNISGSPRVPPRRGVPPRCCYLFHPFRATQLLIHANKVYRHSTSKVPRQVDTLAAEFLWNRKFNYKVLPIDRRLSGNRMTLWISLNQQPDRFDQSCSFFFVLFSKHRVFYSFSFQPI